MANGTCPCQRSLPMALHLAIKTCPGASGNACVEHVYGTISPFIISLRTLWNMWAQPCVAALFHAP